MSTSTPKPKVPKPSVPQVNHQTLQRMTQQGYHRGDVWMVRSDPLNPSVGRELWSDRPGIVVSNDIYNRRSGFAMVVYMTTSETKNQTSPTNVLLPPVRNSKPRTNEGLQSIALCAQIHTVDQSRLSRHLGYYEDAELAEVEAGMALALGLPKHGANQASAMFSKWEKQVREHNIDMAAEIKALTGKATDNRVEAMAKAIELLITQRDSYRLLLETTSAEKQVMTEVIESINQK